MYKAAPTSCLYTLQKMDGFITTIHVAAKWYKKVFFLILAIFNRMHVLVLKTNTSSSSYRLLKRLNFYKITHFTSLTNQQFLTQNKLLI